MCTDRNLCIYFMSQCNYVIRDFPLSQWNAFCDNSYGFSWDICVGRCDWLVPSPHLPSRVFENSSRHLKCTYPGSLINNYLSPGVVLEAPLWKFSNGARLSLIKYDCAVLFLKKRCISYLFVLPNISHRPQIRILLISQITEFTELPSRWQGITMCHIVFGSGLPPPPAPPSPVSFFTHLDSSYTITKCCYLPVS